MLYVARRTRAQMLADGPFERLQFPFDLLMGDCSCMHYLPGIMYSPASATLASESRE